MDTVAHASATALARSLERDAGTVEDLLDDLVDAGLLERTDVAGQYGLPPLVRQFAHAQADPTAHEPVPGTARCRSHALTGDARG
ncbi:hypothetical protein SHIRM173S_13301 [Streptomyces hirsutus]